MKPISLSIENLLLLIILVVGGAMRFIGLDGFSYSGDEVSALIRTDLDSLSAVLKEGVKINDMHPAGVQVFLYYWTKLFGYGEWIVRLPFVLAGIMSIFLSFKIAQRWFNTHTGLITAALLTGLQYFVLFSEIARPYSPGLLFALSTVYFWNKIVLDKKTKVAAYLWFALSCLAAMYTHYYCFLFVGIVGITGVLMVHKSKRKALIFTGIGIVLLYLPHFGITSYQLDRGGLHGWLGPPDKYWLFNYLFHLFNESWILIGVLAAFLIIGVYFKIRYPEVKKVHIVGLAWFFIAFLIGFFYSREVSPIIQNSVMIFCAPFLLMVIADLICVSGKKSFRFGMPFLILAVTTSSTAIEKDFFNTTHFGVIEEISLLNIEWRDKYGEVTAIANVSDKKYLDFYKDKKGLDVDYAMYSINTEEDWNRVYELAYESENNYLSYAWSTRSNPVLMYEMIRLKFPALVQDNIYENSRVSLFSKSGTAFDNTILSLEIDPKNSPYLSKPGHDFVDHPRHGPCVEITPEQEFFFEFKIPMKDLSLEEGHYITIEFEAYSDEPVDYSCVYEIERNQQQLKAPNGDAAWHGKKMKVFHQEYGWTKCVNARKVDPYLEEGDLGKFFFWNHGRSHLFVRNIRVNVKRLKF